MKFIVNLLSHPGKRCLAGFLMVLIFGPLGAVLFPPFIVFVFLGALLFTALGEREKYTEHDSTELLQCELCNTQNTFKLIKVTHYFYSIIPLFHLIQVPYKKSYYIYCPECKRIHCESDNLRELLVLFNGGLVNGKEITAEEFQAKLKTNE